MPKEGKFSECVLEGGCEVISISAREKPLVALDDKNAPCLLDDDGEGVSVRALLTPTGGLDLLPSLYLRELTLGPPSLRVKDSSTAAYALVTFCRFLNESGRSFDDLHPAPEKGPLWGFRVYLVERLHRLNSQGELVGTYTSSTIKSYLSQVVKYYEWLIDEGYLEISEERRPLVYKWRTIGSTTDALLAHAYRRGRVVLKRNNILEGIPTEQRKASHRRVNPFSNEELQEFRALTSQGGEAKRLLYEMQIRCGLRISEAATFPETLVVRPDGRAKYKCEIGPEYNGCKTKNDKQREIEIPADLMADLYEYKVSNNRTVAMAHLMKARGESDHLPLFISNRKKGYTRSGIETDFAVIRSKIRQRIPSFDHKDHDLRRTFATNYLEDESKRKGRSYNFVATRLMELMGHDDWSSTVKYVNYLDDRKEREKHAERLNAIAESASGERG